MRCLRAAALALCLCATPALATLEDGLALIRRGHIPEAYQVLRKAALGGDARAARALAAMLERDIFLSRDRMVRARPEEAAGWYLHAFEAGDKASADALGLLFYQGRGVKRDIAESMRWFRRNHDVDAAKEAFTMVAEADRAEVTAWWLCLRTLMRREAHFPRRAAQSNSWGTVDILIDAAKGTVEIAKSDAVTSLEDAARLAAEAALRQLPPPKGAIDAKLRLISGFNFEFVDS